MILCELSESEFIELMLPLFRKLHFFYYLIRNLPDHFHRCVKDNLKQEHNGPYSQRLTKFSPGLYRGLKSQFCTKFCRECLF